MTESLPNSAPAPESTASIVEAAVADLPESSTESGGYGEIPEAGELSATDIRSDAGSTTPTTGTSASAGAQTEEPDELAALLGITGTGKAKWTQRVPYSKLHKAITERDKKTREAHEAALRTHESRLREVEAVERMITEQPEQFVHALIAQNPAYQRFFNVQTAGGGAPQGGNADTPHDMPAPDVQLQDGTRTYSVAGLQRLLTWNTQQAEQRIAQRLQPFERDRQQRELMAQAVPRVKQQIAAAEQWPLFKESKAEILAVLQSDAAVDLQTAYQRVVIPKLAASRDTIRQDVLKELATRPHSTVAGSSVAGSRADDTGPADTADIVRQALRGVRN
jgi:hypothetical protein